MKGIFLVVCFGLLTAHTVFAQTTERAKDHSRIPSEFHSRNSIFTLRFQRGRTSTYRLIDTSTGRTLAIAQSAICPADINGDIFRGTVDVHFAPDSSAVCIEENVTDASPAIRYILIRREDSKTYGIHYLLPEETIWTVDTRVEFNYELPEVMSLTRDTITFRYPACRQTRKVISGSIHSSETPATAH